MTEIEQRADAVLHLADTVREHMKALVLPTGSIFNVTRSRVLTAKIQENLIRIEELSNIGT